MTGHDPQPGELWRTDAGMLVKCEDGWQWTDGKPVGSDWIGRQLVGYTREYVEKLRAERDADAAAHDNAQEYGETVERRKDAQDFDVAESGPQSSRTRRRRVVIHLPLMPPTHLTLRRGTER